MKSIFVSSTFRDMHYERDIIHTKVEPVINALAMKNNDSITFSDLRWGIDTTKLGERDSAEKVLNVCLDEIDRCKPYMIVILGNRYGWIPSNDIMQSAVEEKDDFSIMDEEISVTELEIEYGALRDTELLKHTIFYFRELEGEYDDIYKSESMLHAQKLESLKRKISSLSGANVRTYHVRMDRDLNESMDKFKDMLIKDLSELLSSEWEANLKMAPYEIDQKQHYEQLMLKKRQFVSRFDLMNTCLCEIENNSNSLYLYGESGCGKSTLLSYVGNELMKKGGKVLPIFCGFTPLCSTVFDVIKYMVWFLEKETGQNNHIEDSEKTIASDFWISYLHDLINKYEAVGKNKLYFLIDGIDQLVGNDVVSEFQFVSDFKMEKTSFIISSAYNDRIINGISAVKVGNLTISERYDVIKAILNMKHKELPDDVINRITSKEDASLPMYINLIVQRLIMMQKKDFDAISVMGGDIDSISSYQMLLVDKCPDKLNSLSKHVLDVAAEAIGGNAMMVLASLLAVSRRGLRISDLEGIADSINLDFQKLDFYAFIQYMSVAFISRSDGRIDFSHRCFRDGFFSKMSNKKSWHYIIAIWLDELDLRDEIRTQEICWHLICADRKREYLSVAVSYYFNKYNVNGLARDLANSIIENDGEWFVQFISECGEENEFNMFINLYSQETFFLLPDTKHNLMIKLKLGKVLFDVAEKRCIKKNVLAAFWDLTIACERLMAVCRELKTDESLTEALSYCQKSLDIRKKLYQNYVNLLKEDELKQKEWFYKMSEYSSMKVDSISRSQIIEVIKAICTEVYRGIIIAHKDMASIYTEKREHHNSLEHIKISISMAEELCFDSRKVSMLTEDINLDLMHLYNMAAYSSLELQEDDEDNLAEAYYIKALNMSEKHINESYAAIDEMCSSCVGLAKIYSRKNQLDKAIKYCFKCKSIVEKWYSKEHSDESRGALAKLYHRLSLVYGVMSDEESKKLAFYYNDLSIKVLKSVSDIQIGTSNLSLNLVITNLRKISNMVNESPEITLEMIDCFSEIFQLLHQTVYDFESEDSYELIDNAYYLLIDVVENLDNIDKAVIKRAAAEINAKRLELLRGNMKEYDDNYRKYIVQHAKAADKIVESYVERKDGNEIPEILFKLLSSAFVETDKIYEKANLRAFDLLENAVKMCELLAENTKLISDYDIHAVTLSRFVPISATVGDKEVFKRNIKQLSALAHFLYRETHNKKYMMMIALSDMLPNFFDK